MSHTNSTDAQKPKSVRGMMSQESTFEEQKDSIQDICATTEIQGDKEKNEGRIHYKSIKHYIYMVARNLKCYFCLFLGQI